MGRGEGEELGDDVLPQGKARLCRAAAAMLHGIRQGRGGIQVAAREACREMPSPSRGVGETAVAGEVLGGIPEGGVPGAVRA